MANADNPACHGNGPQHCCYLPTGVLPDPAGSEHPVCPFLEQDTIPGRKWACGLKRQLGSWDKVHRNRQYKDQVQSVFGPRGIANCGDWRVEGQCCFGPNNDPIYNQGG